MTAVVLGLEGPASATRSSDDDEATSTVTDVGSSSRALMEWARVRFLLTPATADLVNASGIELVGKA